MIRLRSLGECVIEIGDQELTPESEIVFAFALYLIMNAGKAIPRATLTDLFWPEVEGSKARHCLRQTVYRARGLRIPIELAAGSLILPTGMLERDVDSLLSAAPPLLADRALSTSPHFLPNYSPAFSLAYAEWVDETRTGVQHEVRTALLTALRELRRDHFSPALEPIARACLALDPLNEHATKVLAEALALNSRRSEAISILDQYTRELAPPTTEGRRSVAILRRRIAEDLPELDGTLVGRPTFVGRSAQYRQLTSVTRAAKDFGVRASTIWGEPGIGKTRLAAEIGKHALLEGFAVEWVRCQPDHTSRPLVAFSQLIPRLSMLRGALGCAPRSFAYLKRLTAVNLLNASASEEALSGRVLAARIRSAILDLLDAITCETPLLLIIDDADRLDAESRAMFAEILDKGLGQRLCVLLTSRSNPADSSPGYAGAPTILQSPVHEVLELKALDSESAGSIIRYYEARSGHVLTPDTVAWCLRVANGNPLFLEELGVHLSRGNEPGTLPSSLRRLFEAQVSWLDSRALNVLETLAVFGRNATAERVERALEGSIDEVLAQFRDLERSGLILAEGTLIRCKHDALLDTILARCSPVTLALINRKVAQVLEVDFESEPSMALAWDCAHHWQRAGDPRRATRFVTACAVHLIEMGLPQEAVRLLSLALERATLPAQRLPLLRQVIHASRLAREWSTTISAVEESMRIAAELGSVQEMREQDTFVLLQAKLRVNQDPREVLALVIAGAGDSMASSEHRFQNALSAVIAADNLMDVSIARDAYSAVQGLRAVGAESIIQLKLELVYHTCFGNLESGVNAADRLINRRDELEGADLATVLRWCSVPIKRRGRLQFAESLVREALEYSERRRLWIEYACSRTYLSAISCDQGNTRNALSWLSQHSEHTGEIGDAYMNGDRIQLLATIALLDGDPLEARRQLALMPRIWERNRRPLNLYLGLDIETDRQLGVLEDSDSRLAQLEALHLACRGGGDQDLPTASLIAGLATTGRVDRARELWWEYVHIFRREEGPAWSYARWTEGLL
jgi:DNA-binding SARP family transcriptional activator